MAANLEKIADELSNLTVLEAAELSKILEEKWGVSASAPVAVAAAALFFCKWSTPDSTASAEARLDMAGGMPIFEPAAATKA